MAPWPAIYGIGISLFSAATAITLNDHFAEVASVYGRSMAPTLSPKYHETGSRDYILWRKWEPTRNLRRGDIVSFGSPFKPEDRAVKRVVALAGDVVVLNPKRRPEGIAGESWDAWNGRVCVPEGHIWVEGDNWRNTRDSNIDGPISKALIKGKAVSILFPFGNFGQKPWVDFKSKTKIISGACLNDTTKEHTDLWG